MYTSIAMFPDSPPLNHAKLCVRKGGGGGGITTSHAQKAGSLRTCSTLKYRLNSYICDNTGPNMQHEVHLSMNNNDNLMLVLYTITGGYTDSV